MIASSPTQGEVHRVELNLKDIDQLFNTIDPSPFHEKDLDHDAEEFIVMTESGVRYSLEKFAPNKRFYFVANENCNCSECPYMKLNTLDKLRDCLRNLEPRVELSADVMHRALAPLERMLAVK